MKNLKWWAVFVVILYAGWMVMPVMATYMFRADDPFVPSMGQDDMSYQSRTSMPINIDAGQGINMAESIQGETALYAFESNNIPVIALWASVIGLYLLAAFLQAGNNIRAVLAYVFAFVADLVLTFLTKGQAGSSIYDKLLDILSGWDPRYVLALTGMAMVFVIVMTSLQRPKKA